MAFFQSTIRQEGFHPENSDNPHANYFAPSTSKVDFTDELASLMPLDSHERSSYTRPHNIFDTSSFEYHSQTPDSYARNFNSTLPAINSSIRYDPQPESPYSPTGFSRHTPSPAQAAASRSRSRSRPPSGGNGNNSIGPHRTSRTRRTNSFSGNSPPPTSYHHYGRPQAIIIPGRNNSNGAGSNTGTPVSPLANGAWFPNGTGEYLPNEMHHSLHLPSLPHHSHPHQAHAMQYGGFSISPTDTHLPPVSALHPGTSLPKGLDGLALTTAVSTSPRTSDQSPRSSPTSSTLQNGTAVTKSPQEKQLLLASEKRRRRRESHNAVERRRRDNINEKISELATLIPECMLEGGSADAPAPTNMGVSGPIPTSQQQQTNGESTGDGITLSMDSPTSPTSPLSINPIPGEDGVDLWGDLNGSSTEPNGIAKKESMDGLGLYPIGEDDQATPAPGATMPNGTSPTTTTTTTTAGGSSAAGVKANKGMILRKSVEYIRYLQQLVTAQGARNRELEAELLRHRSSSNGSDSNVSMGVGVGMGGAGMGMGMMWFGSSSSSSAPGTTNTASSNGVIDVDDDAGGTSPSAGSGSALTDPDEPPSSKGVKHEDDGETEDGKEVGRGRKRVAKFANGISSSPTNRTLRTRGRNGKAVTTNGYVNGDQDMGSDDEDRMDI